MIDTVTHTVRNRSVHIDVAGAPETTGHDTRLREQTITPARVELFEGIGDYEDPGAVQRRIALVTGPYARERGVTSAVYRTIRIDLSGPNVPDWLAGLAQMYLPEAGWEYRT